jgi:hypothetical protein
VYILVPGGINLFIRPFRECLEPLLYAQRSALKTGDIEGSTLSAALYLFIGCQAGKELIALKQYARTVWFARESHGQKYIKVYVFVMWKLCSDQTGTSPPDLSIDGAPFDASDALRCANKEGNLHFLAVYYCCRALCCMFSGEFGGAAESGRKSRQRPLTLWRACLT